MFLPKGAVSNETLGLQSVRRESRSQGNVAALFDPERSLAWPLARSAAGPGPRAAIAKRLCTQTALEEDPIDSVSSRS